MNGKWSKSLFERINSMFNSAIARHPAERDGFLQKRCGNHQTLLEQVQQLVECHEQAGDFIESDAIKCALPFFANERLMLPAGTVIGRYEILEPLAAGGMAEVYAARDSKLGRKVALKFLPDHLTSDESILRRFYLEAHAMSALKHQNILSVYDIEEADGKHFIVCEFINGQTLRERMRSPLEWGEALDIAIQIAAALAEAHTSGIIHRDIKPENIMIQDDGRIKVLDFGLAKVIGPNSLYAESRHKNWVTTDVGVLMGTVRYMSPEQARGVGVDNRTDIWSLGVVLYEMITRRLPFDGDTGSDVIAAIIERETPPVAQYSPGTPAGLHCVVEKALRKNKEERYQTVEELRKIMEGLRSGTETEHQLKHLTPLRPEAKSNGAKSGKTLADVPREHRAASKPSIYKRTVELIRQYEKDPALVPALTIALISLALYQFIPWKNPGSKMPFEETRITRLTSAGKVPSAAISPDGRYIVYLVDDAGKQSLWVRHLPTVSNMQIAPPTAGQNYWGLTFSHDSAYFFYIKYEESQDMNLLYQVPVTGGTPMRLIQNLNSPITISPDGEYFAFIRNDRIRKESALIIANSDGSVERPLVVQREPERLSLKGLAWSPDGKSIAYAAGVVGSVNEYQLYEVTVENGVRKPVSNRRWYGIAAITWLNGNDGIIFIAADRQLVSAQVWYLSYPGGELHKITNDLNSYSGLSLTADSKSLVTTQDEQFSSIWVVSNRDSHRAKQIASGKFEGKYGLSWTRDGKILYDSRASGNEAIWIMDSDGANQKQLTTGAFADDAPSASPDGRYIVYNSRRTEDGTTNIWRMNSDGSDSRQLTYGSFDHEPGCTPDSKWVIYISRDDGGKLSVWKVPIEGGNPVQITAADSANPSPAISADGKFLAYYYRGQATERKSVHVVSLENGRLVKTLDVPRTAYLLQWAPDGRSLTYVDTLDGISNIWSQSLGDSKRRQVTDFRSDRIRWFEWSPDGAKLACARGATNKDAILITEYDAP
jgi:serine/threonine protein kinase